MDDCANLLARASQCRRLASDLLDRAAVDALKALAGELENQAAIAATAGLRGPRKPLDARYVISRVADGWLVSLGPDRVLVRRTLEGARKEAQRLAGFGSAAE